MKREYKPFDRVLVRRPSIFDNLVPWKADIFSHIDEDGFYITIGLGCITDENILPFEGNEHLLGTTDEPEEEVVLNEGEWGFASDIISEDACDWDFTTFVDITECESYTYFIRFADFDPYNMEETLKHVLLVEDDGKIRKVIKV